VFGDRSSRDLAGISFSSQRNNSLDREGATFIGGQARGFGGHLAVLMLVSVLLLTGAGIDSHQQTAPKACQGSVFTLQLQAALTEGVLK
jgi:hypothetical protein